MNRKLFWKAGLLGLAVAALVGTALGFSLIFSYQGTVATYDFGGFGPGHDIPGTVEIQAFTLDPGENVPWHYHKGLSYEVLVRGNLSEQELNREGNGHSAQLQAGHCVRGNARSNPHGNQYEQRDRDHLLGDDLSQG